MDPESPPCIKEEVLTSDSCVSSLPDQIKLPSIKQEALTTKSFGQSLSTTLRWHLNGPTSRENEEAGTEQLDVSLPGDVTKPPLVTCSDFQDVTEHSVKNFSPDDSPLTNGMRVEEICHLSTTTSQGSSPCNGPELHTIRKDLPTVMNFSPDDSPSTNGIKVEEACHHNITTTRQKSALCNELATHTINTKDLPMVMNFSPDDSPSTNGLKVEEAHHHITTTLQGSFPCIEPTTHTINNDLPMADDSCNQNTNNVDLNQALQRDVKIEGINEAAVGYQENETKSALVTDDTTSNDSTTTDSSRCSFPHDPVSNPDIKTEPCQPVTPTSQMPTVNEQTMPLLKKELPMGVEQPCNQPSDSLDYHLEQRCEMGNAVNSDSEDRCHDGRTQPPVISKSQSDKSSEIIIPDNSSSSDVIKTEPCHDVPHRQNPSSSDQPSMPYIKQETTNVDINTQQLATDESNVNCSLSHVSIEHKVVVTDEVSVGFSVDGAKSPSCNDVPNMTRPSSILPDDPLSRDAIKTIKTEPCDTPSDNSLNQVILPTIKNERDPTETSPMSGNSDGIMQTQHEVVNSVLSTSSLHNPADSSTIQENGLNEEQLDEVADSKEEAIRVSQVVSLSLDPEPLSRIEDDKLLITADDGILQTKQKGTEVSPILSTPQIQENSSTVKSEQLSTIDADKIGKQADGKARYPTQEAVQTVLSTSQHPARLVTIKEEQVSIETDLLREETDLVREERSGIVQTKKEVIPLVLPTRTRSPVTKKASARIEDLMAEHSDGIQVKREVSSPLFEPVVCSSIGDLHGWEDLLNDNQETRLNDDRLHSDGKMSEGDYESRSVPTQGPLCRTNEPLPPSIPVDSDQNIVQNTTFDKPDQQETTGYTEYEATDMTSEGRCANETNVNENCPPTNVDFSELLALKNESKVVQACLEDMLSSVENDLENVNAPDNRGENFTTNLNSGVTGSSPRSNDESVQSSIPIEVASASSCIKETSALSIVHSTALDKPDQHGRTANEELEATPNTPEGSDNTRVSLDGKRSEDNSENISVSDNHGENHVTSADSNVSSWRNDFTKPHATNQQETVKTVGRLSKQKNRQITKPRKFKSKPTRVSKAENVNPKAKSMSQKNKKFKTRTSECHANMPKRVKKDLKKNIASKVKSHKPLERLDASGLNVPHNPHRHDDHASPQTDASLGYKRVKSNTEGIVKKRALKIGQAEGKRRKLSSEKREEILSSISSTTVSPENNRVGKQVTGGKRPLGKLQLSGKQRKPISEKTVTTTLPVTITEVTPDDFYRSNEVRRKKGVLEKGHARIIGKDPQMVEQRKRGQDKTMETLLPVATNAVSADDCFRSNIQERVKRRALEKSQLSGERTKQSLEKTVETLPDSTSAVSTNGYFRSNKQERRKKGALEKEQTRTVGKEKRVGKQRQSSSEKAMEPPIPVATLALPTDDIRLSILKQRRLKKRALRKEQLKGKRMQQTSKKTGETHRVAPTTVTPDDDFRSNRIVSSQKRALKKGQPSGKRRNPSSVETMETPLHITSDDDRIRSNMPESVKKRSKTGQPSSKRKKQHLKKTVETLAIPTTTVSPDDDTLSVKRALQNGQLKGKRRNLSPRKTVKTSISATRLSGSQTDATYSGESPFDDDNEETKSISGEEENEHERGNDNTNESNHKRSVTSAEVDFVDDEREAVQGASGVDQDDENVNVQSFTDEVNEGRKSVRVTLVDLTRSARDPSLVVNYKRDQSVWVCSVCDHLFATFACCRRHEFRHTGKRPYKCRFCDKAFNTNEIKRCHERLHTNERHFVCECGRAFNKNYHLQRHRKVHERKYFECERCDKRFRYEFSLNTHINVHHNNEKKIKCPQCDFRVKYKCQLTLHMAVHTEDRPFSCEQCDFKTKTAQTLRLHMKVHSDIRSYRCGECGMCFRHMQVLKNHYRTHTGEKPFKCQHCDRGFSQSGNRGNHEKICPLQ